MPLTFALIWMNCLGFAFENLFAGTTDVGILISLGACTPRLVLAGEWHRLLTGIFLHFGWYHLVSNMLLLFMLGYYLEPILGWKWMLVTYLLGGIIGDFAFVWLRFGSDGYEVALGSSGAVFALFGAAVQIAASKLGKWSRPAMVLPIIVAVLLITWGQHAANVNNAAHAVGMATGYYFSALSFAWSPSGPGKTRKPRRAYSRYGRGSKKEKRRGLFPATQNKKHG